MKKKLISLFLVLTMILGMLPAPILAATDGEIPFTVSESTPVLTDFKFSQSTTGCAFQANIREYDVTLLSSSANYSYLTATFDEGYTVTYTHNNGADADTLTSEVRDKWINFNNYGTTVLVVTVTDGNNSTNYTFNITRPEPVREDDNALGVDWGGIIVKYGSSYTTVSVYKADSSGNKTEDTTQSNEHKYYFAELPVGNPQFAFAVTPSGDYAKVRYSINNGEWQTWGSYSSPTIDTPTKMNFQIISEKEYYSGTEGWDGKTTNDFTVWVQTAESDSGSEPDESLEMPFTAKIGETELAVEKSSEVYTYTVVTEYDEDWNPITTEEHAADLYTVTVTDPTVQFVTLDFGEEPRLAYGYGTQENYLASYGEYGDGTVGQTTAVVQGAPPYVRVQTPYDENGKSNVLYVVTFNGWKADDSTSGSGEVTVETLLNNTAASYTTNSAEWNVMDLGAYNHADYKLTDAARQAYINAAVQKLESGSSCDSDYAKLILSATAIGIDATQFYPVNSNEAINAIEKLNNVEHSSSAWRAPYVLAAYNQGDYGTEAYEQELLNAVLAAQWEDGAWSEYGDSIQTTSNMLAGLAFYKDQEEVKAAIDKAVTYLSNAQKLNGTFDAYGYGADANTAAMVVIGLSAIGVDPDNDSRFIKGGVSPLDGLMSFALTDGSGFGYTDNTTLNAYATEQGFRALVAANGFAQTGEAYNVYDFSERDNLVPGRATGSGTGNRPSSPTGDNITVSFTIKSDTGYWMNNKTVTIPGEDAMVYHAFVKALEGSGISQVGAADGYVSSMTYNGRELAEFTNGPNSGWLYKVNGALPDVGLTDYAIEDGDAITFYYTNDWTKDSSAGSYKPVEQPQSNMVSPTITVNSNGTANVAISSEHLAAALVNAKNDGMKQVLIQPEIEGTANSVVLELPNATVQDVQQAGVALGIDTEIGDVTLSSKVLNALIAQANGNDIEVTVAAKSTSDVADIVDEDVLDTAAIVEITIRSNDKEITRFGGHWIALDLPVNETTYQDGQFYKMIAVSSDGTVSNMVGQCKIMDGETIVSVYTNHLTTFVITDDRALTFRDVESHWAEEAIYDVSARGLFSGLSDQQFAPDLTLSRGMMAMVLYNLSGSNYRGDVQFVDVADGAWYENAVAWIANTGIAEGYGNGYFGPNDTITREQLAAMLYRYTQPNWSDNADQNSMSQFADENKVAPWAKEAMAWAVGSGLFVGDDQKLLQPNATATRAEVASILQRMIVLEEQ